MLKSMRFVFFLFLQVCLWATDFDCVIVGTSPFSLLEALHQFHSGKKVLILEESRICGGAWKSITVCGVPNVDLGCHHIGNNLSLKAFLEETVGCKFVSMKNPLLAFKNSDESYYFSQGCFELIDRLLYMISVTNITLLTETKLEEISIDPHQKIAHLKTEKQTYEAKKVILTPMSSVHFNLPSQRKPTRASQYHHLYLLIQDPTPFQFTYHAGICSGMSRLMNLTPFLGIGETGRQLIVIQTNSVAGEKEAASYLEALKSKKMIDQSAYILQSESVVYETNTLDRSSISKLNQNGIIEILETGHFQNLSKYIPRWKETIPTYPRP